MATLRALWLIPLLFLGCEHQSVEHRWDYKPDFSGFSALLIESLDLIAMPEPNRYQITVRWEPRGDYPVVLYRRHEGSSLFEAVQKARSSQGSLTDTVSHRASYTYYLISLDEKFNEARGPEETILLPLPDFLVQGEVSSRGYHHFNRIFFKANARIHVPADTDFSLKCEELYLEDNVAFKIPADTKEIAYFRILTKKAQGSLFIDRQRSTTGQVVPVLIHIFEPSPFFDVEVNVPGHAFLSKIGDQSTENKDDPFWSTERGLYLLQHKFGIELKEFWD